MMRKIKRTRKDFQTGMEVPAPDMRPRIQFTGADLPEMEDWDLGEKYTLMIEVEMVEMRKGSEWNEKDKETHGTFRVNAVGTNKKKKGNLMDDEEYADAMDQARGV